MYGEVEEPEGLEEVEGDRFSQLKAQVWNCLGKDRI